MERSASEASVELGWWKWDESVACVVEFPSKVSRFSMLWYVPR